MKNDITTREDIVLLVDTFYGKVRTDELLQDIFESVLQDHWDQHLEKMYRFWQTVLLGEHTYFGSPFLPHAKLPIEKIHFDRWLDLFNQTLAEHFDGPNAQKASLQAQRMAVTFLHKILYYRNNPNAIPLI